MAAFIQTTLRKALDVWATNPTIRKCYYATCIAIGSFTCAYLQPLNHEYTYKMDANGQIFNCGRNGVRVGFGHYVAGAGLGAVAGISLIPTLPLIGAVGAGMGIMAVCVSPIAACAYAVRQLTQE
jgi:hypothetical protein